MRRFGLIGRTLKHSFSRNYFSQKFLEQGIDDCSYENFELQQIDELPLLIRNTPGLVGLNVTIPYKEEVIPYLHHLHNDVKEIGACNCIRLEGGRLYGFNTDSMAFEKSLRSVLKTAQRPALVLGNGGASKAVQYALRKMGIDYSIVTRNNRANELRYEELDGAVVADHHIIINTTPLGTFPHTEACPPIPYDAIGSGHLLFDLVYNPARTEFLRRGEEQGARIMNGYQMLVEQAEESWKIWNTALT